MSPIPLHELKAQFDRIGQHRLFGDGRTRDIESTLQRISNIRPDARTKDYARRIIDVLNGKGREEDIVYFKILLRQFQESSGISARTFLTFLRRSKAPKNLTLFPKEVTTLDKNAMQYSVFLEQLELLAKTIELQPNGQIIKKPGKINLINKELFSRFQELKNREEQKAKDWIQKYIGPEESKLIVGKEIVFGCVVLIVNSKYKIPNFISLESKERGHCKLAKKDIPTIIVVDVNPDKRIDGVSIKTSLVHELRHGLFDIFRRLMINDLHNPILSATMNLTSPELPQGIRSRRELFERDRQLYTYLLNRQLNREDYENITKQRAYLDELHSSILQRKDGWFNWSEKIYSTEILEGYHLEMVGNNPEDIKATKDMFCYLQGFFTLEKLARESLDPNSPWYGKVSPRFIENISKYFNRAGSLIATSLTVQQASRLIGEMWRLFIRQHPNAPLEYIFNQLPKDYIGQPSNGQSIGKFLMPK